MNAVILSNHLTSQAQESPSNDRFWTDSTLPPGREFPRSRKTKRHISTPVCFCWGFWHACPVTLMALIKLSLKIISKVTFKWIVIEFCLPKTIYFCFINIEVDWISKALNSRLNQNHILRPGQDHIWDSTLIYRRHSWGSSRVIC